MKVLLLSIMLCIILGGCSPSISERRVEVVMAFDAVNYDKRMGMPDERIMADQMYAYKVAGRAIADGIMTQEEVTALQDDLSLDKRK